MAKLEHGRWNQGYHFAASRKVDYLLRAKMSAQMADVAVMEQAHFDAAAPGEPRRPPFRCARRSASCAGSEAPWPTSTSTSAPARPRRS